MVVRKTKRSNSNQKRSNSVDHNNNNLTTNTKLSSSSDTSSLISTNSHNSKPPTISLMPTYQQPDPNQDEVADTSSIKQEEDQTITMMPKYNDTTEVKEVQQPQQDDEEKEEEKENKEEVGEEEEAMTPPLDSPNSVIPNSLEPTTPNSTSNEHDHQEFDPTKLLQICPMPSEFKQPSIEQIKESINKDKDQKDKDQVDKNDEDQDPKDKDQVDKDDKKIEYRQPEYKQYFAPWNVPLVRRRQTLAHVINLLLLLWSHALTLLCLVNPFLWPFFIGYLIFIAFDNSPEEGARAVSWWRKSPLWKWYADFYPARLINEAKLDPQRNYIFGYHPHGIIGMGAMTNFATDATGVDKIFPGLNIRTLTLASNFRIPFYREHLLSLGAASVSKRSIRNILSKGPGHSCVIVVGGAEEALEAKPDRANLILARRYGFIKMALECGADLVPTFGFGENQLYDQASNDPGTWLHTIQHHFKALTGLTPPLFYGRGIFLYRFGIFPHRIPLTVVTGPPIPVHLTPHPTEDQVRSLHTQYLTALTELYDRNKGAYWVGSRPPELKFV